MFSDRLVWSVLSSREEVVEMAPDQLDVEALSKQEAVYGEERPARRQHRWDLLQHD